MLLSLKTVPLLKVKEQHGTFCGRSLTLLMNVSRCLTKAVYVDIGSRWVFLCGYSLSMLK